MKILKEILGSSLIASLVAFSGFVALEAQIVAASHGGAPTDPDTDVVLINQTVTSGITISDGADVTMSQAISTGANTAVGTTSWTVITNDTAGYTLAITAEDHASCASNDALCDIATGNSFTDRSTVLSTWSVTNAYEFGFSAFGSDNTGWGTGSLCESATNVPSTSLLYSGLSQGTGIQIASSTTVTPVAGTATTVCFAAEQAGVFAPSGTYQATTTGTATTQ